MTAPHPALTVRRAEPDDATVFSRLDSSTLGGAWSAADFAQHIESGRGPNAAALLGTHIAGFICCAMTQDEMEVYRLAVAPLARRRGIGTELVRYALDEGRKAAVSSVHLEVAGSNTAAIALYAKLGFKQVRVRRKYYTSTGDDALVMVRVIR